MFVPTGAGNHVRPQQQALGCDSNASQSSVLEKAAALYSPSNDHDLPLRRQEVDPHVRGESDTVYINI